MGNTKFGKLRKIMEVSPQLDDDVNNYNLNTSVEWARALRTLAELFEKYQGHFIMLRLDRNGYLYPVVEESELCFIPCPEAYFNQLYDIAD